MKKRTIKILAISLTLTIIMAALFTYLSVLGENNRITNVAAEFFIQIRKQHYGKTYQFLSKELRATKYSDPEQFYATCFQLEATLLAKYNLLDQRSYTVVAQKHRFWTPLLGAKTITISIGLKPKEKEKALISYLKEEHYDNLVENLLTLVREDGYWKVGSINIGESSVADLYQQLGQQLKLDRYIQTTPGGFVLASIEVIPQSMSSLERRRLSFIIHKITRAMYQPQEDEETGE
ncbi:MAG TPA: hypothetical protein PLG17_05980 [Thermodesulfobacteriota bacterium]|nr:hypothetical protein [Deltaproteobacteria bacterium]HNR12696.1 hypothetical protein [Thermodesulfobacteriota bacterium]HNU71336.1 hypothetical protein [Thermodesulfobacteriota bacterium]HOC39169.1 hypothetical protein [Thermodesulfobacteriota bacterium]HQO78045.1 hypothetical protein [Thermodesulfobacteriota bacterium]